MKIENLNVNNEILIIAEIGNNHEGSYALAEEMIGLASESGADAVKFQTIIPNRLVSINNSERIQQLEKFQLSYEEFNKLSKVAKQEGLIFLSTPFDIESALFLNEIVPAYKVASGDNNFYPLIDTIAKTGKPIILSTGLMNINEVNKTALFIRNIWKEKKINQKLALLHCVSCYPTPYEDTNLLAICDLKDIADVVGYSDHTLGINAAILSVAVGSRIIEKHFTLDNNYSNFHDHELSANPNDFKKMVDEIRFAEKILGSDRKMPSELELEAKQAIRRSIVANHDLDAGHKIQLEDLEWVRPGGGFRPGEEAQLIGKRVIVKIDCGSMIKATHLEVS